MRATPYGMLILAAVTPVGSYGPPQCTCVLVVALMVPPGVLAGGVAPRRGRGPGGLRVAFAAGRALGGKARGERPGAARAASPCAYPAAGDDRREQVGPAGSHLLSGRQRGRQRERAWVDHAAHVHVVVFETVPGGGVQPACLAA